MRLDGAKILVTGASSGIGAALAPQLAGEGATVGIVARRAERLEAVVAECRVHTPESTFWAADLGDVDRAVEVALTAWDHFGGLDALVNNAAIGKRKLVQTLTPDDVDVTMRTNFFSPVRMGMALLPRWLDRGDGLIVNVSSMGGRLGILHEAAYSASKFALCGWSESMRMDLEGTGREGEARAARPDRDRDLGGAARASSPASTTARSSPRPTAPRTSSPRWRTTTGSSTTRPRRFPAAGARRTSSSARPRTATTSSPAWPRCDAQTRASVASLPVRSNGAGTSSGRYARGEPGAVEAGGDPLGQLDGGDRTGREVLGVDDHELAAVVHDVVGQREDPPVALGHAVRAGDELRLADDDAVVEAVVHDRVRSAGRSAAACRSRCRSGGRRSGSPPAR